MSSPAISFGNFGLGEHALIGVVVLYLFGFSGRRSLWLHVDSPTVRRGRIRVLIAAVGGLLWGVLVSLLDAPAHLGNVATAVGLAFALAWIVALRRALSGGNAGEWAGHLIAASVFLVSWGAGTHLMV